MTRLLLALSLVFLLVAAGCGSSKDSASDSPAKVPKGATKVDMKDIKFVPMNVTVKKGKTVTWTNSDSVSHNVTKEKGPGADFRSSTLNNGDAFSHTFTTPGKYDYVCTIHPNQTGTVTVK